MKPLSQVPWELLKVGDIVFQGYVRGEIVDLISLPVSVTKVTEPPNIAIRWDGVPNLFYKPHTHTQSVTYVGRSPHTHRDFIERIVDNFVKALPRDKHKFARILDTFYPSS